MTNLVTDSIFRQVFEQTINGVLLQSDAPRFTVMAVSSSLTGQLGKPSDKLIGSGIAELLTGEGDPDDLLAKLASAVRTRQPATCQLPHFSLTATPLLNDEEQVTAVVCTIKPVHEPPVDKAVDNGLSNQNVAEMRLQESERRFRAMVEQSPVAMAVLRGRDLVIETANQAILDIWDKTDAIVGLPHAEALPEINSQVFMELMLRIFETNEPFYGFEAPAHLFKNGEPRIGYFNYVYVPAREPEGTVSGILVVTSEVTEQVVDKLRIAANEKRFRTLLETIPNITWTSSPDGKVDFFNQQWYEYTGLGFDESSNWQWQSVVHPDDRQLSMARFSESLKTGNAATFENRYRRADGQYRWHLNRALPLHDEHGKIVSWVGTATDIHEQKELVNELDRQVQLRTQQLEQTNQDLRRSNENLTQFAYVASHDLQEPLRKVQSFGDMLKDQYASQLGDGIDYLDRMNQAAARMSVLIKDLLAYSRISTQQETADKVALGEVIGRVLDDLEVTIRQTGATMEVSLLPVVQGNALQLGQLFQNLISNAIKFRKPDVPPVVHIDCELIPAAELPADIQPSRPVSQYYRIQVSDNGIGFEEKFARQIFEVFQRLHTRSQYAGTGIGLAIVQKVAINHGGGVTAESQPGRGALFCVYIPG